MCSSGPGPEKGTSRQSNAGHVDLYGADLEPTTCVCARSGGAACGTGGPRQGRATRRQGRTAAGVAVGHVEALQSERHDLHCPFPGSRPRSQRHPEPATGRPQGSHLIPLLPSRGTRHGLGTGTQAAPAVTVGERPGHVHVGPTVLGSCDSLARPRPVSTRGSGVLGRAGLDVQGGLLAGEEPEHGGGHGLHVDLPRRGMSACPRRPSCPPGIALATAAVAVCVEEELEGRPGGWGHRSAP